MTLYHYRDLKTGEKMSSTTKPMGVDYTADETVGEESPRRKYERERAEREQKRQGWSKFNPYDPRDDGSKWCGDWSFARDGKCVYSSKPEEVKEESTPEDPAFYTLTQPDMVKALVQLVTKLLDDGVISASDFDPDVIAAYKITADRISTPNQ